ncbi:MAG: cytochrome c biogenesis protein DipZ [Actinomycetota bacterium]|nr:cytochrome c biogenesis protein DipZ [Actinomycetota bacterium]
MVLLGIAFLAGLITALSPCVLPVLPILLAGGASGRRPFGIILGLVGSFSVFTVIGASLLNSLGLPQDVLRNLAIVLLFVVALTLLVPQLAGLAERPLLFLSRRQPRTESNGVVLGMSLGLVFVPCGGPVLAAVTALSATGGGGLETFTVALAYSGGHALPMLAIAVGSRRLTRTIGILRLHAEGTRRVAGALLAVSAVAITLGVDRQLATAVPGYTKAFQDRVERSPTARRELAKLRRAGSQPPLAPEGEAAVGEAPVAPEFQGIVEWLNSKPLSLKALRGRVVLVDFWTYSCINCLRTFPHLKAWDRAYRDDGLTIVGVHSPEFAFERVPNNVQAAVSKLGIRYPVGLDNNFVTWTAYANEYWPAKYLIDRAGRIRYFHPGEGEYDETERLIRRYLGERVMGDVSGIADRTPKVRTTPESYLGYLRLDRFVGSRIVANKEANYRFPRVLSEDQLAYSGRIRIEPERLVAGQDARLRLQFRAQKVHLVVGGDGTLTVRLDGRRIRRVPIAGEPRLHTLLSLDGLREGLLELHFTPRLSAYAFTFG